MQIFRLKLKYHILPFLPLFPSTSSSTKMMKAFRVFFYTWMFTGF